MREKENQSRNLMRLTEQFLEIVRCFQKSKRKLHIKFSLEL
jgi:hypothetical protein